MKFGPLTYSDPRGVYEEDPDVTAMQAKMERALVAKAGREIRKLVAARSWVFHAHGSSQHSMTLGVEFSIVTAADIQRIEDAARSEERARMLSKIRDILE